MGCLRRMLQFFSPSAARRDNLTHSLHNRNPSPPALQHLFSSRHRTCLALFLQFRNR